MLPPLWSHILSTPCQPTGRLLLLFFTLLVALALGKLLLLLFLFALLVEHLDWHLALLHFATGQLELPVYHA